MNKMLATPERYEFHAEEFDPFIELLRDFDQHTVRMTIGDAEDIELDANGQLKNGDFQLAPLAIKQICRQVSKGLWSLAADIAGEHRSARAYDSACSVPLAARIINDCVKLRFRAADGIAGRDMIQNHLTRVVDGVVGPRYQLLPNHQLLEAAKEMLESHAVPMKFHYGLLVGRRMAVSFLTEDPIADTADGPMHGGAYFSNSEAGECGVRGAATLQIGHTLRCMAKLRHLSHSGKDFIKRLSRLLGSVLHSWDKTVEVAKRAEGVMAKKINFLAPDDKVSKAARIRIQTALTEYMDKSLADDVVRKVIFMGADGTHVPRSVSAHEIATRKVRDVAVTLMREAYGQYPEIREGLERAAFDIIAEKIHPWSNHGNNPTS